MIDEPKKRIRPGPKPGSKKKKPDPRNFRPDTERTSFTVPAGMKPLLRRIARHYDMTVSQMIRAGIDEIIARKRDLPTDLRNAYDKIKQAHVSGDWGEI